MEQVVVQINPGDLVEYYIPKYDKWFVGTCMELGPEWINIKSIKNYLPIKTRQGKVMLMHKRKIKLKYSFDQELTELLETGTIKTKETQKENNKMAKFTTIGMIAKKKDGSGSYIKMDADVSLKKGQFITISKKPTEEQVEANPKLKLRADKWPTWKVADLVLVTDN